METAISFFEAIFPGIVVGIVMSFWTKGQKKKEMFHDKKEKDQIKYDTMRLDLIVATAQLSYATAMAIKRGTPNGEMEAAIEKYEKAMSSFREYERVTLAKKYLQ